MEKYYVLSDLSYPYHELLPVMSEELLHLHHDKHHKAYVDKANELVAKLAEVRERGESADFGSVAKKLSFNVAGHALHTLFWESMKAPQDDNKPEGELLAKIESDYGSFERFQVEFQEIATTIEGSGWAALTYSHETGRLQMLQIGNHNLNLIANQPVILALDMWEHAYYLDYKNDKKSFSERFWSIVDWPVVGERLERVKG